MADKDISEFKHTIENSKNIVGFTGAGISTDSGIPDYRSKGGIWDKFQPVYFDEFISNEEKRILYWRRKIELWEGIKNARPSKGHKFFKDLFDRDKLAGLITQNIDGLHEKSGLPKEMIVNLHGSNLEVICLNCGLILSAHEIFKKIDLGKGVPLCQKCRGLLKPNTISFGQQLRAVDLERANELSLSCDLMIAMGSTLIVHPASTYPVVAKRNGAILAIVTLSETPLDKEADFVFHQKIDDFVDSVLVQ